MTAVIVFTKNEEKIIFKVIDDLERCLKQVPDLKPTVFVCDDSDDTTKEIVKSKGCKVIEGSGKGLGWSYYKALHYVTAKDSFHSIITLDGDGQADMSEIAVFWQELKKRVRSCCRIKIFK